MVSVDSELRSLDVGLFRTILWGSNEVHLMERRDMGGRFIVATLENVRDKIIVFKCMVKSGITSQNCLNLYLWYYK